MRTPSGPRTAPSRRTARLLKRSPLILSEDLSLPLRQDLALRPGRWVPVLGALRATLEQANFEVVTMRELPTPGKDAATRPFPDRFEVIAERPPRGAPMSPAGKVSVFTLLGAGIGLGIFDAVAVGAPLVAIPWGAGAVFIAFLFWYRYGRGFESDVVVVSLRAAGSPAAPDPAPPMLIFVAGQVRSDVRAGDRTGISATGPPWLAHDLGTIERSVAFKLRKLQAN